MRFRPDIDLVETTIDSSHAFVANVAYQLKRSNGLLDRLELAIKHDVCIEPDGLSARRLTKTAQELRALAAKLEQARDLLLHGTHDVQAGCLEPIDPNVPF